MLAYSLPLWPLGLIFAVASAVFYLSSLFEHVELFAPRHRIRKSFRIIRTLSPKEALLSNSAQARVRTRSPVPNFLLPHVNFMHEDFCPHLPPSLGQGHTISREMFQLF